MRRGQAHGATRRAGAALSRLEAAELGKARLPLVVEGRYRLPRLSGAGMHRQPVPRVLDGLGPDEVAPPVQLGLRVAHRLGQLPRQVVDEPRDRGVELRPRNDARHQSPLEGRGRRNRLAQHDDLARPPVADDEWQPLRRPAGRHRSVLWADVADVRVVHQDREVTRHLELVAAPNADPVDTRDRRLADMPQAVVHLDEGAHPPPVLAARGAHRCLLIQVGPRAEGAVAGPGHDHDRDLVVPGRLLERARQLAQRWEVERVEDLRTVNRDRHHAPHCVPLVANVLEAEAARVSGSRRARLRHRPHRAR